MCAAVTCQGLIGNRHLCSIGSDCIFLAIYLKLEKLEAVIGDSALLNEVRKQMQLS